jgi:exosortase A-associated hydrolase 2
MMTETPFFFGDNGGRLFGVLHEPASVPSGIPFVLCHAFGEEKLWAHRVFVTFARSLARRGHVVLRFDYLGNGDSEGDFADWSLAQGLANIGLAIDEVKKRASAERVGLLGLRLGGSLASQVAEERDDIARIALWSPIVDGHRYMQELLRVNLSTQMAVYGAVRVDREGLSDQLRRGQTVNVDGYEVSPALYEQLSELRLAAGAKRLAGPCLIAQIDRKSNANALDELVNLKSLYAAGTLRVVQEDLFWKETLAFYDTAPNLSTATLEWLDSQ